MNHTHIAIEFKEFFASAEQKDIEKEVKQLSRVKHPNIIALHGISSYQQATYLIMEYAEGGSLHNFLHGKVKPAYSLAHAMSWARQCAEVGRRHQWAFLSQGLSQNKGFQWELFQLNSVMFICEIQKQNSSLLNFDLYLFNYPYMWFSFSGPGLFARHDAETPDPSRC